jgi:hypothetical protein
MEIATKRTIGNYNQVTVRHDSLSFDLGLLDDDESRELAKTLIDAAFDLCGKYKWDADEVFRAILVDLGIDEEAHQ